jgi:hypothetical protein
MLITTTAGTYGAEAIPNSSYVRVHADSREALVELFHQLELSGAEEGEDFDYDTDAIGHEPDAPHDLQWVVRVRRTDYALWVQSEILNFMDYRDFRKVYKLTAS